MTSDCLDQETLTKLVNDTLPANVRDETIRHLDNCENCQSAMELAFGNPYASNFVSDSTIASARLTDVMEQPWCCLDCSSKFTFGDCQTKRGSPNIHCPECGGANLHQIGGTMHAVSEYVGPIGPVN